MINFSTPSRQLMAELFDEEGKAIYWLKKQFHGDRGYEKMRDGLIAECARTRKTQVSEVVEYISQKGNRWMAFECCQYYKGAGANTMPMAFCYYETYGSVGAFMVGRSMYDTKGVNKSVIHFTNHFFLRFCQRLGVPMRSRWMVQKFVEVIPGFLFGYNGKDDKGHDKFDVRLPGSIGRGIRRDDAPVIEIRTYLTDPELNGKQLRETKRLRDAYDRQTFEPPDVRMSRLAREDDFTGALTREIDNVADMTGMDRGVLIFETNLRMFITEAIIDLGYVRADDKKAWKRIGEQSAKVDFTDFISAYQDRDSEDTAVMLYEIIREIGEYSGIRGYDPDKVMDKVIEKWRKAAEEQHGKEGKE